ncbi:MAG: lipoprotein [Gammaproteobacteria bacterium]|nr:lipoprotein [Gammaproteobacteria bacterium]
MLPHNQLYKSIALICLLLMLAGTSGCGNKGPLTHPDASKQQNR